jgi:hypothetical protein
MITISVSLVKPGPDGGSFQDYTFQDDGTRFPRRGFHILICAGLKSSNGVAFAHLGGPIGAPPHHPAVTMPFASLIEGRPLITQGDQKVESRFVIMQYVFETTFAINAKAMTDGSQAGLYLPMTVADLKENSGQSSASN